MMDEAPLRRRTHHLAAALYAEPGCFFITICACERRCIFGKICAGAPQLNSLGRLAWECWYDLARHWSRIELDIFVVMPNHVHGIVRIMPPVTGRTSAAPTASPKLPAPTLPRLVQAYKASVTRLARKGNLIDAASIWQRNYYDHVIRDELGLDRVREYVLGNPVTWTLDRENPRHVALHPFYVWLEDQTVQFLRQT